MVPHFEELEALLKKIESANGPDHGLNLKIGVMYDGVPEDSFLHLPYDATPFTSSWWANGKSHGKAKPYTASIDAAVSLVERLLPNVCWSLYFNTEQFHIARIFTEHDITFEWEAETAPLAILGALVCALISLEEEK